nr:hypothetical protein [Amycolatopsis sp. FDAARGOS 1241]
MLDAQQKLNPLVRDTSPFANEVPRDRARGARWVEPRNCHNWSFVRGRPGVRGLDPSAARTMGQRSVLTADASCSWRGAEAEEARPALPGGGVQACQDQVGGCPHRGVRTGPASAASARSRRSASR